MKSESHSAPRPFITLFLRATYVYNNQRLNLYIIINHTLHQGLSLHSPPHPPSQPEIALCNSPLIARPPHSITHSSLTHLSLTHCSLTHSSLTPLIATPPHSQSSSTYIYTHKYLSFFTLLLTLFHDTNMNCKSERA